MFQSAQSFGLVIIGGGPAGLSPLLAAHRAGDFATLLANGVAVVEQSAEIGGGSIGNYVINSDSSGRTFVDCLTGSTESDLTRLADHPLALQLAAAGDNAVPLRDAGRFLALVGQALHAMIARDPRGAVLVGHRALSAVQMNGLWRITIRDLQTDQERTITARNVVIATGAHQPLDRLAAESVGGCNLMETCGNRLMQSGDVFSPGGLAEVAARLAGKENPRVVIAGGSTSAAAVAHALLHRLPEITFRPGGIVVMHRRPLRIFYLDRASALAENYTEWTEEDVCPISGRVFRFAGFRLDSRELIMQARGIGGRPPEPRLRLHQMKQDDVEVARALEQSDLVIAALGYRPHALPILDRTGKPISLLVHSGAQRPMVDNLCRVLDAEEQPIAGLFGIGLAAGFVPRGRLGGEPSFRGQANGLWLWQHDVGSLIVDAVCLNGLALPAEGILSGSEA